MGHAAAAQATAMSTSLGVIRCGGVAFVACRVSSSVVSFKGLCCCTLLAARCWSASGLEAMDCLAWASLKQCIGGGVASGEGGEEARDEASEERGGGGRDPRRKTQAEEIVWFGLGGEYPPLRSRKKLERGGTTNARRGRRNKREIRACSLA